MFTGLRLRCGIQFVNATRRRFGRSRSRGTSGLRCTAAWSTSGSSTWRCAREPRNLLGNGRLGGVLSDQALPHRSSSNLCCSDQPD
jgi:hypothetical protein